MTDATIQVRHLNGSSYAIPISLDETIGSLKEKVFAASDVAAARQRIIFKGAEVHNHVQMRAAGLTDGAVVHLVERLIAPTEDGTPAAATRPEQASTPPPLAAATMGGGGLEVVNTLVQQMIGGLLGHAPSGAGSPLSPGSPRGRVVTRNPNGLEAVHGFINAIGELEDVADPPALLPVARSGVPLYQSGYESVTRATLAILRDHSQQHGSLHSALSNAANSQNIDSAAVDQVRALFTRVDQAHTASRASAAAAGDAAGAPSRAAAAAGASSADATATSPLAQGAAAIAEAAADGASPAESQHVQKQLQLAVLVFALTMARSAQCMQRFTERMTDRAQQLVQEVVREIAAGEPTFPASQVLMEQLGTAANRASGLTLESAFLCSLFTQAVRGDHSLLPDGMRPVVIRRDSQSRPSAPASSAAAASAEPASGVAAGEAQHVTPAPAAQRSFSINPGYAPMIIPQGSAGGSRFRMQPGIRSSVSMSGDQAQMEMFMAQGTDAASDRLLEEMLAGSLTSTAQTTATGAAQAGAPAASTDGAPQQAASGSTADDATASTPSTQQLSGIPIFHSAGGPRTGGMGPPGIHVASSVVTGGLPFGNSRDSADRADGTVDVGGMIIQVELPPDGSTGNPNVHTTGIGQLGSVLQNMMQEQLAAARVSQGRSSPAAAQQGAAGGAQLEGATPEVGAPSGSAPPAGSPAPPPSASSLPQRVLELTQQFVEDLGQHQSLPEAERSAAGARMAEQYLQQVPQLLRQTLPGVAAGVDSFMSEIRGGSGGSVAPSTVPAAADGSSPAGPAARALDISSEDPSPTPPEELNPPAMSSAPAASPSSAAQPAAAAAGPSGGTASESTKPERSSEPKGLARGLKPRKPKGLGLGTASRAAPSTAANGAGSGTRSVAAPEGAVGAGTFDAAPTVGSAQGGVAPPPGLQALLGGLGGAAGAGGGGLMDMVTSMAQNPDMQRMMSSPQMQNVANQTETGNADLGSIIQQMMPMVGSMLGGGAGGLPGMPVPGVPATGGATGPAAAGARGAQGSGATAARSAGSGSVAEGVPDVGGFRSMLGEMMGESEADRWMKQIIQDRSALRRQQAAGASTEHSEAYSAGAIPEEAAKGGFLGM